MKVQSPVACPLSFDEVSQNISHIKSIKVSPLRCILDIFNKYNTHLHIQIHIQKTSNTKCFTFHIDLHRVKFYCGRGKGKN